MPSSGGRSKISNAELNELERLLMTTQFELLANNVDARNSIVQLDSRGTMRVARRQRQLLKTMIRASKTAAGAAAIALLVRRFPWIARPFKAALMHTLEYASKGTREWFVEAFGKLRSTVKELGAWIPAQAAVQNAVVEKNVKSNKPHRWYTKFVRAAGSGLAKTGTGLAVGGAYLVGVTGRAAGEAVKFWLRHPEYQFGWSSYPFWYWDCSMTKTLGRSFGTTVFGQKGKNWCDEHYYFIKKPPNNDKKNAKSGGGGWLMMRAEDVRDPGILETLGTYARPVSSWFSSKKPLDDDM